MGYILAMIKAEFTDDYSHIKVWEDGVLIDEVVNTTFNRAKYNLRRG